jgi:hypothetical protein
MASEEQSAAPHPRASFFDVFPLPPRRFTIETPLTPDEVYKRLTGVVGPRSPMYLPYFARTNKLFAGNVTPREFKIMRVIRLGNGSLPVILGTIEPTGSGARVTIMVRLMRYASIFMMVWLAVGAFFIMVALFGALRGQLKAAVPVLLFGAVIMALGFIVMSAAFSFEARRARMLLEEALQEPPSERIEAIISNVAPPRWPTYWTVLVVVAVLGTAAIVTSSIVSRISR